MGRPPTPMLGEVCSNSALIEFWCTILQSCGKNKLYKLCCSPKSCSLLERDNAQNVSLTDCINSYYIDTSGISVSITSQVCINFRRFFNIFRNR